MNIISKKRLTLNRLAPILAFAISAFLLLGCDSLPAVSSLFATVTPTATTTFTPTSTATSTPTLTPTRTPRPTPTATPDQRVQNPTNQHLYLYVKKNLPWHEARNFCTLQGGHLVTIQDDAENTFIFELSREKTWLGATDEIKEGTWVWVSEEPWKYTNWDSGEPNNSCPPRNCGGTTSSPEYYLTFSGVGATWNDVPQGNNYFVCEWETASP